MLETAHRDGRARVLDWTPSEGRTLQTPLLLHVDTERFGAPADAAAVLTARPGRHGAAVEIVSDGTWFHPRGAEGDLVIRAPRPAATSAVQVIEVGDDLAVWHDAGGWASRPTQAVAALIEARRQATPGRLLYAPGFGEPADYALWAYLGMDAFDTSPLLLAAVRGEVLSADGRLPVPAAAAIADGPGADWDTERVAAVNVVNAEREIRLVQQAIQAGTLRALAERRALAHPDRVALLRRFDREHMFLDEAAPVHKDAPLACMTVESLASPEVERFRRRLRDRYVPPAMADVLVLLPCSATKPYKTSPSHRFFARGLDDSGARHRVHEVMVTSPLGLVPRELEEVYPADRYDVPVTGHWSRDEEAIIREQLAALLEKSTYRHVIAHVPASTFTIVRDLLPEQAIHSARTKHPQSRDDCQRLRDVLRAIRDDDPAPSHRGVWSERKRQDIGALASFQFGHGAAADLTADGKAHGRWPYVKLDGPEGQRGMTTPGRGLVSLTLGGAAALARHGVYRVHMGDFILRKTGSLFAVGVEDADPEIRPGDDVVVMRGDTVTGCGQALMSAGEMVAMQRGVAVQLRHVVKEDPLAKAAGGRDPHASPADRAGTDAAARAEPRSRGRRGDDEAVEVEA